MIYFDHVQFFADVGAYATRRGHGPKEIELYTGVDDKTALKVWQVHEFTFFYQGFIHVFARLAVYADLSLDSYVKEQEWTPRQRKRTNELQSLRRSSASSTRLTDQENPVASAVAESEQTG